MADAGRHVPNLRAMDSFNSLYRLACISAACLGLAAPALADAVVAGQDAGRCPAARLDGLAADLGALRGAITSLSTDTSAGMDLLGRQLSTLHTQAFLGGGDAAGANARAFGGGSRAIGAEATAVGAGSQARGDQAVAIGNNAVAAAVNSVALGKGSIAAAPDTVSVGAPGAERRITNVGAGLAPTDAVNVMQLREVERRAHDGVAMALALASARVAVHEPGEKAVGAGVGHYGGGTALAVSLQGVDGTGKITYNLGASGNTRGWSMGAGIGLRWK